MPLSAAYDKLIARARRCEEHRRRHGGAITAAQFCSVSSVIRLGHLDVAGVAMDSTKNDISQMGIGLGCASPRPMITDKYEKPEK